MEQNELNPSAVQRRLYWPQLDGLRFLAAMLVILHHAPLPPGIPKILGAIGWMGVDLFLVLSAYLLARMLREEVETTNEIRLSKYFARRVLRIWPLFWGIVTAALCLTIYTGEVNGQMLGLWLSHITFFNNFLGFDAYLPYTGHLWTISLEEQFYLAIPFVLPILMRQSTRRIVVLLILALSFLILTRVACVLMGLSQASIWMTPLRGDAFILGIGFALGAFDRLYHSVSGNSLFVSGFLLLFGAHLLGSPGLMTWKTVLLYTVTDTACLLMLMGCMKGTLVNSIFCTRPVRYLGRISFGLYVFHFVSIGIATKLVKKWDLQESGWLQFALILVFTLVLSVMSYELYEKWFLRFKHHFEVVPNRPH